MAAANAAQDWFWLDALEDPIVNKWDQDKTVRLSSFKNKAEERRLWWCKMANLRKGVVNVCVLERPVNVAEFRLVHITQKFERLGWEKVLDWCDGARP